MLVDLFRAATPENPSFNLNDPDAWDSLLEGSLASSGLRINRESAMTYSAWWRGINLLAGDVGKTPAHVYQRAAGGKSRAERHPSQIIIRRKPNEFQTAFQFRRQLTSHALSTGNGFAYIFRRGDASIREMLPLNPDDTFAVRENGKLLYVTTLEGKQYKLLPENVFHLKGLGFDGLTGYSVVEKAREDLGLAMGGRKHATIYFKNAARPAVILETPNKINDQNAKVQLRTSWERMHRGLDNAHRTAVLDNGLTAKILSFSARDSQMIESRKFSLRDVANWIGVPPHKIGDDARTSYASLEQENQAYLDDSLDTWFCTWEEEYWDKCLTEQEKRDDTHFVEFLRAARVRTDLSTRGSFYNTALGGAPWMTRNEVRAAENLNPIAGGDELMDPLNMANNIITP